MLVSQLRARADFLRAAAMKARHGAAAAIFLDQAARLDAEAALLEAAPPARRGDVLDSESATDRWAGPSVRGQ
jgi:hypothetical protein